MKAEKLIKDYTKHCSNELCAVEDKYGKKVISYHEWLTPEQALSAVQIEREEMVESITNILKSADYKYYISTIISGIGTIKFDSDRFVNDIIKDFKKVYGGTSMSQLPDEVYMPNDSKYSTLDFFIVYDEYAEEVEEKGIENFTMYIPVYRKEEAIQEVIKKACEWLREHKDCVATEDNGISGWIPERFIEDFKEYMNENS